MNLGEAIGYFQPEANHKYLIVGDSVCITQESVDSNEIPQHNELLVIIKDNNIVKDIRDDSVFGGYCWRIGDSLRHTDDALTVPPANSEQFNEAIQTRDIVIFCALAL